MCIRDRDSRLTPAKFLEALEAGGKGMDIQHVLGRMIYTLFYTTGGVIGTPINV